MASDYLRRLLEYNTWANLRIIDACAALNDEQLDAEPNASTKGSIRVTLWHLMAAQQRYVWRATGQEPTFNWQAPPSFAELREAALISGEQLLAIAKDEPHATREWEFEGTKYSADPWVLTVQTIYHAGEHREQIKSMLSALEITPPEIDEWLFGESTGALRDAKPSKH
jgi:uncharacterized damage-inducible protein DinB